jgi:hypothetical protein
VTHATPNAVAAIFEKRTTLVLRIGVSHLDVHSEGRHAATDDLVIECEAAVVAGLVGLEGEQFGG